MCGSCGDRTTTTESELSVRTVNIGTSVCIQYGHTPCLPIINSMNNRWNNHTHFVALFFVVYLCSCLAENRNGEKSKAPTPFQKRPYMYAYSMVILNAFPLLTVDKKLSMEVTSKLERLEYSYKHCTDKEDAMVGVWKVYLFVSLFWRSPRHRGALDKKIWFNEIYRFHNK